MEELQKRGSAPRRNADARNEDAGNQGAPKERDEARQVISLRSIQSGVFGQPDLRAFAIFRFQRRASASAVVC